MKYHSLIWKRIALFIMIVMMSSKLMAQDAAPAPAAGGAGAGDLVADSMQDLSIVVGVGLVGAILGLSTLSFVEEPKEHLSNVVTGGAIGIILGVGIVAYNQATKSKDSYLDNARFDNLNTNERVAWHKFEKAQLLPQKELPFFTKNFSF